MEYRFLGQSGFKVPALSFGAGTFGGKGPFFSAWGNTGEREAQRIVDICLDAGVNLFDTADVYSDGASETILGAAVKGRRGRVILSTKLTLRAGSGPNDVGASRSHLIDATNQALARLGTDYIDLLQLHHFDAQTPVESVMSTLDDLVRAGKVRYLGVSNFSGWQLMKSQAAAERHGYSRFVANQTYYSLIGRDYEWELMPLGLDQESARWCGARWAGGGSRERFDVGNRCRPPAVCTIRRVPRHPSIRSGSIASSMRWMRSQPKRVNPLRRSRSTGYCSVRPSRPC